MAEGRKLAAGAGSIAAGTAIIVLVGWWTHRPGATTLVANWPPMTPSDAAAFVACSAALAALGLVRERRSAVWARLTLVCATMVVALATITILEYHSSIRVPLGGLLGSGAFTTEGQAVAGRMAEATAWSFALLGAGLALLAVGRRVTVAQVLILGGTLVQVPPVLSYLGGDGALTALVPYAAVSLPTAVLLQVLGAAALWLYGDRGAARTVSGTGLGAIMARRLFVFVVLVLVASNGVEAWGRRAGWYGDMNGEPLLTAVLITAFAGSLYINARLLSRTEAERDRFFDLGLDLFCILDAHGAITKLNGAFARALGWESEELANRPVLDLVHPDDRAAAAERLAGLGAGVAVHAFEARMLTRHGSWRVVSWSAAPGPQRGAIYAAGRDVTELHETEAALRANEESLRVTLESIADGVMATDAEGRVVRANPAAERLTGWPEHEAVGRPLDDIFHLVDESTGERRMSATREVLRTGGVAQPGARVLLRSRDGHACPVSDRAAAVRDGAGAVIGAVKVFRDVTAERQAERLLRDTNAELERRVRTRTAALTASEQRFSALFEFAPDGIVIGDRRGRITLVNREAERIFGWTREELAGQPVEMLVAPSIRDAHQPRQHTYLANPVARRFHADPSRMRAQRKDGTEFPIELSLSPLEVDNDTFVIAAVRDVTDQTLLAEQFQQAQKMESVGRLAGAVAHDFNNILTVINGIAEVAVDGLREGDPLRGDLQTIRDTGWRAAELTRQLLAFSRRQVLQPRVVNLNEVIGGVAPMLRRLMGEPVRVEFRPATGLGNCRVDVSQMEQIVMNLAVNGRDAMPRGGVLTIETVNSELDEEYTSRRVGIAPGRFVTLCVTDTGVGMDADTMTRIFEPFFTTKGLGKGTGLGLSTVYGIAKQSGGDVHVYSEVGVGTTFRVYFPMVDHRTEHALPSAEAAMHTGAETVLTVEDEPAVRGITTRLLERAGYTVVVAESPAEALELAAAHRGGIDLLMTDLVMPGMNGRELAERFRAEYPSARVLFTSGYTDDTALHHGVGPGDRFIAKPFTAAQLTRVVRDVLDA